MLKGTILFRPIIVEYSIKSLMVAVTTMEKKEDVWLTSQDLLVVQGAALGCVPVVYIQQKGIVQETYSNLFMKLNMTTMNRRPK